MNQRQFIIDDYEIDQENLIGRGCQGSIFPCRKLSTNEQIVAKITKVNYSNSNSIDRQIDIVNQLKTRQNVQNLVKMYDIISTEYEGSRLLIEFMEKCESDLGRLIKEYIQNEKSFTYAEVIDFAGQIIRGYSHLNQLNIIHRDLKPENILINKRGDKLELKITDFGVGKVLTNDYAITNTGSPIYSAPELSCSTQQYTSKADIFSLGVILYQIIYNNEFPFKITGRSAQQVKSQLKNQPIKCPFKNGFDSELLELINQMLLYSPDERISWDQLEKQPYFKNYFPEIENFRSQNKQFQFYEYIIAGYNQTSKIIQIIEKLPTLHGWQEITILMSKYILIHFQNELIQIIHAIINNRSKFNKSIVSVPQHEIDKNAIKNAIEKNNILLNENDNAEQINVLRRELEKKIQNQQDNYFKLFYPKIIKIPEDQSMFDFWHMKFQEIYKEQIRTWLSKYLLEKQITLIEIYMLEKFSNLLVEYPKTSYSYFQYNQIYSRIISQDVAVEYLRQKQLI